MADIPIQAAKDIPYPRNMAARARRANVETQVRQQHSLHGLKLLAAFDFGSDFSYSAALKKLSFRIQDDKTLGQGFASLDLAAQSSIRGRVGSERLEEIFSLSQNPDAATFWREALHFGVRLKAEHPEVAIGVFSILQQDVVPQQLRHSASRELDSLMGKGHAGMRAEVLLGGFAKEATRYQTIVPMIAGSMTAKLVGTAVLGRLAGSSGWGWLGRGVGARVVAGGAGFVVEVPVFTASARLLAGSNGSDFREDLSRAGLTIGALRLFGFLGNQAFLKIHGVNELSKFTQAVLPQASIFTGLWTSHHVEERLGLRPRVDGATTTSDILASMLSLGVGSRLGHGILGPRFAGFERELGIRSGALPPPRPLSLIRQRRIRLWRTKQGDTAVLVTGGVAGPSVGPTTLWMAGELGGPRSGGGSMKEESFQVGGRNSTELLRGLKSINGHDIETLETWMQPGAMSKAGFLGKQENLREVLAADNEWVLSLGLSHQIIAEGLQAILAGGEIITVGNRMLDYEGRRFLIQVNAQKGELQESPFRDGSFSNEDFTILNMGNGKAIRFSGLLPAMIGKYGFYEGPASLYRLEPKDILETLDFLKARAEPKPVAALPQDSAQLSAAMLSQLISLTNRILRGEAGAWPPAKAFLVADPEVENFFAEVRREYEINVGRWEDSEAYSRFGISEEVRREALTAILLMGIAFETRTQDPFGLFDYMRGEKKINFNVQAIANFATHAFPEELVRRVETLEPLDRWAFLGAAPKDPILLALLGLVAARGQDWARHGLGNIEAEKNAEIERLFERYQLALMGRGRLILEIRQAKDGEGQGNPGDPSPKPNGDGTRH